MRGPNTESDRSVSTGVRSEICQVIVWDEHRHRRQQIAKIIENTGLQPVAIEDSSDCFRIELSANCFLAVTSAGTQAGGPGMQVIQYLRAKRLKIIAYEDGAQCWPIGIKCLPLLAGAVQLFDSSSTDFFRQLRDAVDQTARMEAQRLIEADEIRRMMSCLGVVGESAAMMSVFRAVVRFSTLSDLPLAVTAKTRAPQFFG